MELFSICMLKRLDEMFVVIQFDIRKVLGGSGYVKISIITLLNLVVFDLSNEPHVK